MSLIADELSDVDEAFGGNRLLSTFDREARGLIEGDAAIVELKAGEKVLERGSSVSSTLFPFGSTMIGLVVDSGSGRSIEAASIGREGAVGGIVSCGHAPAFSRASVLMPGSALRIPMKALEGAKQKSSFVQNIFCRYSDYLLAQTMQNVACNAFHSITQRAARWLLLAQDRAGDRIELTQEALAGLLGVQRTTLNAAVAELSAEALVMNRRGHIRVLDRSGLKRRSCECYRILEDHFAEVIGDSGRGATTGADC